MRILDVIHGLWLRHGIVEKLRKEMKMTKGCCRELDLLLGSLGIDLSNLELCPIPAEHDEAEN